MTLTMPGAPLGTTAPADTNYRIEGPAHRILFSDFPRRVRAVVNDAVVLDTTRGRLLHESNILPALYVPIEDVRMDLLEPTELSTHCPFKGDASYWSVTVGDRVVDNAFWGYPTPNADAPWLEGYVAPYVERMDAWFDEDEQVEGHLRDPYHRVDARRSSRTVVVRVGDVEVARTGRPVVVSETGLPNRFYVPEADIRTDLLVGSTTGSHCPYKGDASYWSMADGSADDVAWGYPVPFDDAVRLVGHRCFLGEAVTTEVDGVVLDG